MKSHWNGLAEGMILGALLVQFPGTAIAQSRERVVYHFEGGNPQGGLIDVNGTLYGTTVGGGESDLGTVFSIDPSTGAETVLHSFSTEAGYCGPNHALPHGLVLGQTLRPSPASASLLSKTVCWTPV
jgi:uncharacterized repeat protein (TIGR03803 family)